jgi:predicted Holliday junction resolvase-like endonuclease
MFRFDLLSTWQGIAVICPNCSEPLLFSDLNFLNPSEEDQPSPISKVKQRERQLKKQTMNLKGKQQKFAMKQKELRAAAVRRGRRRAKQIIRRLDKAIANLRLDPNDIKVIGYPVDLLVFDGLADGEKIKRVLFLSRRNNRFETQRQRLEELIRRRKLSWNTLRIQHDGNVTCD